MIFRPFYYSDTAFAVVKSAPAKPADMDTILRFNQGRAG